MDTMRNIKDSKELSGGHQWYEMDQELDHYLAERERYRLTDTEKLHTHLQMLLL